jgi:hypothetical protein
METEHMAINRDAYIDDDGILWIGTEIAETIVPSSSGKSYHLITPGTSSPITIHLDGETITLRANVIAFAKESDAIALASVFDDVNVKRNNKRSSKRKDAGGSI